MTTRKSKDSSGFKMGSKNLEKLEQEILGESLSFGMAVESLRICEEFTQAEFAKRLGVSRQYLCDVEKGRRLVSPEQAARFAKTFGHPPEALVQLALQDSVRASGLKLKVSVKAA